MLGYSPSGAGQEASIQSSFAKLPNSELNTFSRSCQGLGPVDDPATMTIPSSAALLVLVGSALVSAEVILTYPGWRGNNLITNATFPFGMQPMFPCESCRSVLATDVLGQGAHSPCHLPSSLVHALADSILPERRRHLADT